MTNFAHKKICLIFMVVAGACASAPPSAVDPATSSLSPVVQYLKGKMMTTSPDGAIPYGPPSEVLAKRTIDQASGTIVENSWHGKEEHKTMFVLRSGTMVFDVGDETKTFEGTVILKTKDWLRGSVSYDIKMLDQSGTLTGTGEWTGDTYSTNKLFLDSSGTAKARMTETLKLITEADFLAAIPK
jgi:hypothetical protein